MPKYSELKRQKKKNPNLLDLLEFLSHRVKIFSVPLISVSSWKDAMMCPLCVGQGVAMDARVVARDSLGLPCLGFETPAKDSKVTFKSIQLHISYCFQQKSVILPVLFHAVPLPLPPLSSTPQSCYTCGFLQLPSEINVLPGTLWKTVLALIITLVYFFFKQFERG